MRMILAMQLSLSFALPRFLRDLRSCSSLRMPAPVTRLSDATAGIYIHIPFCRRRCFYCDFPIKVIGDRESSRRVEGNSYTELLLRDITSWSSLHGMQQTCIDSIYFGGGTPSLLPDDCIETILNHLRTTFRLSSSTEITFEMDPGTFDYDRILRLRTYGINRLSIGVQSFREDMLKVCGRVHTVSDVSRALDDLSRAQWDNFSIDLISSLPHHTMDSWRETLQCAIQNNCPHISVYDLQVEDKTAFSKWYSPGVFPLPAEELSADMFGLAARLLTEAGYEHYEVSNYALPGKRSRHNQKYWRCAPMLAFGMSAVSYLSGDRFARPQTLVAYATYVDQLEHEQMMSKGGSANKNVSATGSHVPDVLDVLMLSLRTADGIDARLFSQLFGDSAMSKLVVALLPYIQRGIVIAYDYDGNCLQHEQLQATFCDAGIIIAPHSHHGIAAAAADACDASRLGSLRLSDPQGFLISNDIISTAFAAFS